MNKPRKLTERKGSYVTVTAFKPLIKSDENDLSAIPKGIYCYSGCRGTDSYKSCPYWSLLSEHNGYCKYLQVSDDDIDGLGLLWDQCKECGINTEEDVD